MVMNSARSGMNCLLERIMHKKDLSSSLGCGLSACCTALTFSGSGLMPSLVTLNPQIGISDEARTHLFELTVNPAVCRAARTWSNDVL